MTTTNIPSQSSKVDEAQSKLQADRYGGSSLSCTSPRLLLKYHSRFPFFLPHFLVSFSFFFPSFPFSKRQGKLSFHDDSHWPVPEAKGERLRPGRSTERRSLGPSFPAEEPRTLGLLTLTLIWGEQGSRLLSSGMVRSSTCQAGLALPVHKRTRRPARARGQSRSTWLCGMMCTM